MQIDLITIFPHIFSSYTNESILAIAQKKKKLVIKTHDLRSVATDKRRTIDDKPYGGGPGMLMMVEPWAKMLKKVKRLKRSRVIMLDPAGKQFTQKMAADYAKKYDQLIFVCGRYEGFDERITKLVDERVSVGPYVLSGGELPALIITEAVTRLLPGVLGHLESTVEETFSDGVTAEYPHYTRPEVAVINGKKYRVPKVLLSGDHKKIAEWRKGKSK